MTLNLDFELGVGIGSLVIAALMAILFFRGGLQGTLLFNVILAVFFFSLGLFFVWRAIKDR